MIRREGGVGGGTGRGTTLAALVALMLLAGLTHYTVTAGKCHWLDFVNLLSSSSSTWDLPRWLWRNKEKNIHFFFSYGPMAISWRTTPDCYCYSLPGGFSHLPTYLFFFFLLVVVVVVVGFPVWLCYKHAQKSCAHPSGLDLGLLGRCFSLGGDGG